VHVRLAANGLCCKLSHLRRQIDRSSLQFGASLRSLLILLLLVVLFNNTTDSGNCILATQGHEDKVVFVTGMRNHSDVVDIDRLRDRS